MKIRIYETVILTPVLYICKTWPLSLREEYGVLRNMCAPGRDEITVCWKKLHNE